MRWCPLRSSNPITPARSPSTSITNRPNRVGSSCDRSTSATIAGAVERPVAAEERLGLLAVQELDEPVDVAVRGAADRDAHAGASAAAARRTDVARRVPSVTPARISASPASAAAPTLSSEEECAVGERHGRDEVGHERRVAAPAPDDEREEDEVRDGGADDAETAIDASAFQPGTW